MRPTSGPTVVVVEDNDEVRGLLRATLERGGYRVVEAADGREGSRVIVGTAPALVLLDIDLPDMNGLELCRQLKASPATARVPIVIVSAAISQTDRQAGLAAGADDYVTKPFSPRALLARVNERLGSARARG